MTGFPVELPLPAASRRRLAMAIALACACAVALTALCLYWAGRLAEREAIAEVARQARAGAQFHVATLRRDLEKHRALPFVLANDPDLRDALTGPDPGRLLALDAKLRRLAQGTGASVIYLLNRNGLTLAASNYEDVDSFVGENYRFRPYYQRAMVNGAAEHFALGTVSRRPGLYLSHRIDAAPGQILGVVVVKVEFTGIEQDWARLPDPVLVTGEHGVVLLTSEPAWRFRTLAPIDEAVARQLRQSLQFGESAFGTLPMRPALDSVASGAALDADVPGRPAARYVHTALAVPTTAWTFHQLTPIADAAAGIRARMQAQALVILLMVYVALAIAMYTRQRLRRHNAQQAAIRAELQARVQARTAQLQAANDQLRAEMDERRHAEQRLHAAQEELVQANKLASLGQIAAGVAHEINQPVAAIRSYADNAGSYLERGDTGSAATSLHRIQALTERIGAITGHLRTFARKGSGAVEPTPIDDAIAGALLLLGPRLQAQGVELARGGATGLRVQASRLRLEQVLVNLLQNALDALIDRPAARIALTVREEGPRVAIDIADNGPGIPAEIAARLFTPFSTSKPEGLGLGLVISRDIVAEFGGTLETRPAPGGGAVFTMTLNRSE